MTSSPVLAGKISTFADAEARLAETLPGYESRPPQQRLAAAVEAAIVSGVHLIGEAGCGTGKSFGYLIPAILSGKRVIVSTATKALQDQIANGDLPFLAEHLGVDFTYAILKGRGNYICPAKMRENDPGDVPSMARITTWIAAAGPTFTGTRDEFPFEIPGVEWMRIASDSEDCGDLLCKEGNECFAERARRIARDSQIVVVNHALYLTDLVVKDITDGHGTFLGEHGVVIFDEAHEIEEYASSTLGATFKESGVRGMVTEVKNFSRRLLAGKGPEVDEAADAVLTALTGLWTKLAPGRIRTATLIENADEFVNLANALGDLAGKFMSTTILDEVATGSLDKAKKTFRRLARRTENAASRFEIIVTASFDDLVRWVETENFRGTVRMVLKSAPVNVGPYLSENLFDPTICKPCDGTGRTTSGERCKTCQGTGVPPKITAILTSATMSISGSMAYIAGRLGIETYTSLDVGSPFDFATQARLYVPKHLPDPTPANRAAWGSMMIAEIGNLVRASSGRALLLFTSNASMRAAYDALRGQLPYTCLVQGSRPNAELAATFASDTSSVLFATRSFMTGVDFQGATCSLVVIDKLPFPVPTDALVEARCDAIKAAGGNDFRDYTIPVMVLVLKQAFGRLIRHRNDTGVVAILDPRLLTKGYGKGIVNSLPPATRITEPGQVTDFFAA